MLEGMLLPGLKLLLLQLAEQLTATIKLQIAVQNKEWLLIGASGEQEPRRFVHTEKTTSYDDQTGKSTSDHHSSPVALMEVIQEYVSQYKREYLPEGYAEIY